MQMAETSMNEPVIIEFELREPTILQNVWQRMHYTKRKDHSSALAWSIRKAAGRRKAKPLNKCIVSVLRYSSQLPDWDGLYGGLKPLLDCLVVRTKTNPHGLGFIKDDNPNVIIALSATPYICKPKEGKTIVRIISLEETER